MDLKRVGTIAILIAFSGLAVTGLFLMSIHDGMEFCERLASSMKGVACLPDVRPLSFIDFHVSAFKEVISGALQNGLAALMALFIVFLITLARSRARAAPALPFAFRFFLADAAAPPVTERLRAWLALVERSPAIL